MIEVLGAGAGNFVPHSTLNVFCSLLLCFSSLLPEAGSLLPRMEFGMPSAQGELPDAVEGYSNRKLLPSMW